MNSNKRVLLSMGGKGGVGKTSIMVALAEWFEANQVSVQLLDLDTENKARGSLTHYFGGTVPKVNIHTAAGLDAFVDYLADGLQIILADMGAGSGQITYDWFEKMYPNIIEARIGFTTIGVITADPASVESVLAWAAKLQKKVSYLIVENCLTDRGDFTYWHESSEAKEFRRIFQPAVIQMDFRLPELETAMRNYGARLGDVASRTTTAVTLQRASLVMRAQSYRRRMFAEFDRVRELLLP
jgi:MinD-like ATPase involved in chromosome partitioning or flagellar assembly